MTPKLIVGLFLSATLAFAEDAAPATAPETAPAPEAETAAAKFVVFLPEQVDSEWFWYYYSDTAQHVVQSAVEKALINSGFDVIDPASLSKLQDSGSIEQITSTDGARAAAQEAGAAYAIVGTATAVKASQGEAYGVTVIRSSAQITAKILRVSDGKILAVEEASAQKGGQAQRAAGQEALKDAGSQIARKLAAAAKRVTASP